MTKRAAQLASVGMLALLGVGAQSAEASYVAIFEEVGSDVVETGGGTLDLTDLSVVARALNNPFLSPATAGYDSGRQACSGALSSGR